MFPSSKNLQRLWHSVHNCPISSSLVLLTQRYLLCSLQGPKFSLPCLLSCHRPWLIFCGLVFSLLSRSKLAKTVKVHWKISPILKLVWVFCPVWFLCLTAALRESLGSFGKYGQLIPIYSQIQETRLLGTSSKLVQRHWTHKAMNSLKCRLPSHTTNLLNHNPPFVKNTLGIQMHIKVWEALP
jgi:hypothetical protein